MKMSDKLNELSFLSYFMLERRKNMKNFLLGGLVGVLGLYSLGASYLLYYGGGKRVRGR